MTATPEQYILKLTDLPYDNIVVIISFLEFISELVTLSFICKHIRASVLTYATKRDRIIKLALGLIKLPPDMRTDVEPVFDREQYEQNKHNIVIHSVRIDATREVTISYPAFLYKYNITAPVEEERDEMVLWDLHSNARIDSPPPSPTMDGKRLGEMLENHIPFNLTFIEQVQKPVIVDGKPLEIVDWKMKQFDSTSPALTNLLPNGFFEAEGRPFRRGLFDCIKAMDPFVLEELPTRIDIESFQFLYEGYPAPRLNRLRSRVETGEDLYSLTIDCRIKQHDAVSNGLELRDYVVVTESVFTLEQILDPETWTRLSSGRWHTPTIFSIAKFGSPLASAGLGFAHHANI